MRQRQGLRAAARTAGEICLAVGAPAVLAFVLVASWRDGKFAVDFHDQLYLQARALLDTGVAFDPPSVVIDGANRIFTPLVTFLATPLALLDPTAGDLVMTALLLLCAAATLRVLGVRDWRVYAVVALWPPFLSGIQTANVTFVISLLAALAWRYRDRRLAPGIAVGLAVAVKLYPWPLAVWLLATRRYAAAAAAAVVGAVPFLLVTPFGSPLDYFRLIRKLGDVMAENGYSVVALLGAGGAASAAGVAVAAGALVATAARRRHDAQCFILAVLACLACTPIVWLHYLQLLVVPLAIVWPRLGVMWLVPLATWLVPFGYADRWQIALTLAVVAVVFAGVVSSAAVGERRPGTGRFPFRARRLAPAAAVADVRGSEG